MRGPVLLGPCLLPLSFENSHVGSQKGPYTAHLRTLVPKTRPGMVFRTRVLERAVYGPLGAVGMLRSMLYVDNVVGSSLAVGGQYRLGRPDSRDGTSLRL